MMVWVLPLGIDSGLDLQGAEPKLVENVRLILRSFLGSCEFARRGWRSFSRLRSRFAAIALACCRSRCPNEFASERERDHETRIRGLYLRHGVAPAVARRVGGAA